MDAFLVVCERSAGACFERIVVKANEYEAVRRHPGRFLVALGHEENGEVSALVVEESLFLGLKKLRNAKKPCG